MTGNPAALYRRVAIEAGEAVPDWELLARFATACDEAAFAELVRRHGPTVFGVCRRAVGHHHDAEDAFQATFVVLARKAARIDRPALLGNWLYGVAVRVAGKARRRAKRRAERERTGVAMPDPPIRPVPPPDDLANLIDIEIARLPAHYRDAVLLCDVQGVPRPEAAARLGVPEGTLSSRLANGRKKLAGRLAGRGVTLTAAGTFAVAVPDALAGRTVATALAATAGAVVPYPILELTYTGGSVMRYAIGAAILTTAGMAAGAVAAWPQPSPQDPPKPAPVTATKPEAEKPATANGTIRPKRLKTIDVSYDATQAHWSSDGRFLAVEGSNRFDVFDTQTGYLKVCSYPNLVVGFVPGTHDLLAVTPPSTRINAAHKFVRYRAEIRSVEKGNPPVKIVEGGTVDLDDHPGFWIRLMPTGKQVVSIAAAPLGDTPDPAEKEIKRDYVVRVTDVETGNPVRSFDLPRIAFRGAALSPDGKILVVVRADTGKVVVNGYDVGTGTAAWRADVSGEGRLPDVTYPISFSPDGSIVFVAAPFQKEVAGGNDVRGGFGGRGSGGQPPRGFGGSRGESRTTTRSTVVALATATGKAESVPYLNREFAGLTFGGLSADGTLFAFATSDPRGEPVVVLSDAKTGKVLKSWSGYAIPSFAPNRPTLALLEPYIVRSQSDASGFSSERHTSIGFWDCAPLK